MEKLVMDTDKIKEQGEELKSIATDLSNIMNDMYSKLLKINENGIWSSETTKGSSQRFIENVIQDKANNYNLCKNINKLGNSIIQYSDSISSSSDTEIKG